jgi:S-adenosylmethionine uptake transporter
MSKGIWLCFIAFLAYAISDACAKAMHGALPPYEMGLFGALFSTLLLPFLLRRGSSIADLVRPQRPLLWAARGLLAVLNISASIVAFTYLTMAEAFSLIFIMPLVVAVLSVTFLKERVTPSAWLAIVLGFVGVLIVLRPGFRDIGIGQLAGLSCGVTGAISTVLQRYVGSSEKLVTQFGGAQLMPFLVFGVMTAGHFVPPTLVQWLIIAGYAVLAAVGSVLLTLAGRLVPASLLAPTQYSQMLWGTAFGAWLFADHVDWLTVVGIMVIVGAGLWLFVPRDRTASVSH